MTARPGSRTTSRVGSREDGARRRRVAALTLATLVAMAPLGAAVPGWASSTPEDSGSTDDADTTTPDPADPEDLEEGEEFVDDEQPDEDEESEEAEEAEPVPLLGGPSNPALPAELDINPGWNWTTTCDPQDRPGVEAVANLLTGHFGREVWTSARTCLAYDSEHHEGRAIDWNLNANDPEDLLIADSAVAWLIANDGEVARRLGVQSVIWNHEVWHNYKADQGLQPYDGPSPHTDHIHISLTWDGAYLRTSWWTGFPLTEPDLGPCATYEDDYAARYAGPRYEECTTAAAPATGLATVLPGNSGDGVGLVQDVLGITRTGVFDEQTQAALLAWQAEQRIPVSGVLDQATYAAALNALGGPRATGTDADTESGESADEESADNESDDPADGGAATDGTPAEGEAAQDPSTGDQAGSRFALLDVPPSAGSTPWTTEFTPHAGAELGVGDQGDGVRLLQQALGLEDDGVFGEKTAAAVREYTSEHPWLLPAEQTSPLLWHVLELQYYPTVPLRANTLEIGDTGELVVLLQDQLDLEADGDFGPATQTAVIAAQQADGLAGTGVVDPATWAAIDAAHPDGEFHGDLLDVTTTTGADDEGWVVPLPEGYRFVDGALVQDPDTLASSDR